jgi:UBX domain-containing protein 1
MNSAEEAAVRRFVQETGAPEAVARNALAIQNGNYVRAKQAYLTSRNNSSSKSNSGGVATLGSLSNAQGTSGASKKRNELYAGGASSGIAQLGPSRDNADEQDDDNDDGRNNQRGNGNNVNDLVSGVLDNARRQGAVDHASLPADDDRFAGQGRRLGDGGASAAVPAKTKPNQVAITFYRNGFTTAVHPAGAKVTEAPDRGPIRAYDDPAQQAFLDSINQGRVPDEFRSLMQDGVVLDVSLVDKKSEEWAPPKGAPAAVAFTGHGQTLGSSSASSTTVAAKPAPTSSKPAALTVDESQPTTSLRVRLLDGKQTVVKCNQSHTIAQIRAHVDAEAPPSARYIFVCTSMRPPKRDLDESKSVKEADLLNATLHQQQQQ